MEGLIHLSIACMIVFALQLSNADVPQHASVLYDAKSNKLYIEDGYLEGAVAWGKFSNQVNETGWSFLEVHTKSTFSDDIQSQAAGMVEGFLTAELISMHWKNTLAGYCNSDKKLCQKIQQFLDENAIFLSTQIDANIHDKYWYQVRLLYQQLSGLQEGYMASSIAVTNPMTYFDFMLMQLGGLSDLEQALMNRTSKHRAVGQGSCSALIKLLPDNMELFISQVTWNSYVSMLRVYKLYELQLINNANPVLHIFAQNQSFSSYPGVLYSGDDYYMLSSGLVVQETTNDNLNADLWQYVTTHTVMEWARTVVANRIAHDGRQWVSLFSKFNSGTYNNQWMVLDYKQFTPGKPIQPDTLWVLEQLPGMEQMGDMSLHLKDHGYWASYNLPFFPTIFNMSGMPAYVKKYGSWFDYNLTPRAQIFRRDQGKVVDIKSMLKLMRYNDYKNDPLSKCNCTPPYSAENAISSRCDLNPANGTYPIEALGHREHGATDAKMTNYEMFQEFTTLAVSGPTYDQQPVFQWSTSGWSRPLGHPNKWDFKPVMVSWSSDMEFPSVDVNNLSV